MRSIVLAAVTGLGVCAGRLRHRCRPERGRAEGALGGAEYLSGTTTKTTCWPFCALISTTPSTCARAQVSQPLRKTVGQGERYVVCVRYRERKGGGDYGPPKDGAATYVSAKLDRFFDAPPAEVKAICKDVPLEPFPELEKLKR